MRGHKAPRGLRPSVCVYSLLEAMYSTKTIHKNLNPNYPQGYTTIGDPYNGNNDKLPSRWKEKQFVTQKLPKNADNGLFVKLKYNSEPYIEMSERVSAVSAHESLSFVLRRLCVLPPPDPSWSSSVHDMPLSGQYSKTQPLKHRKLGFGSRDASKTGEFTCHKTTERYRTAVRQEQNLLEAHRDEGRERALLDGLPRGPPVPPKDRDGTSLTMPTFMYDIGRTTAAWTRGTGNDPRGGTPAYDPKSTRDCFYSLPKHAKGDIRRLGGHRPSSAAIGAYAWQHKYGRPEHGSSHGCKKFYDKGHLDVPGF